MGNWGLLKNGHYFIVCGSKEKAEEMQLMYPEAEVHEVERVKGEWIKA